MYLIEHTYGDPALDLALDELLLDELDRGDTQQETLRLWHAQRTFVVMGRSGRVNEEVYREHMDDDGVALYRRCSGGGTVVAAPGCAFFSLVLSLDLRPELRMVDAAHNYVMTRLTEAIKPHVAGIRFSGHCDLVVGDRKVSGNSLRIRRRALLYHGTFLLNMDLRLAERYLRPPPREPEYRQGRPHSDFIQNLPMQSSDLREALIEQFSSAGVSETAAGGLVARAADQFTQHAQELAKSKYSRSSWTDSR